MAEQRPYWDRVAYGKTFTHPVNAAWLRDHVPLDARILDYGCGYGRSLAELAALGYSSTVGVDSSPRMVERGGREFPSLDLRVVGAPPIAEPDASFDAVLLLAVLTCIPDDGGQDLLMREVRRLLRPGGLLHVTDMPLRTDARNLARYGDAAPRFGVYGVFETADGAVVRHHDARAGRTLERVRQDRQRSHRGRHHEGPAGDGLAGVGAATLRLRAAPACWPRGMPGCAAARSRRRTPPRRRTCRISEAATGQLTPRAAWCGL